jgi:hypothetical protein
VVSRGPHNRQTRGIPNASTSATTAAMALPRPLPHHPGWALSRPIPCSSLHHCARARHRASSASILSPCPRPTPPMAPSSTRWRCTRPACTRRHPPSCRCFSLRRQCLLSALPPPCRHSNPLRRPSKDPVSISSSSTSTRRPSTLLYVTSPSTVPGLPTLAPLLT